MPLKLTPPQPFEVGQTLLRDNLMKMATEMLQKFPMTQPTALAPGRGGPVADAQRLVDTRMGQSLLEAPLGIGERLVGALSKGGRFVRGLMGEQENGSFDPLQAIGPVAVPEQVLTRFLPKNMGGAGLLDKLLSEMKLGGRGLGEVEREIVEGKGLTSLFELNQGLPKSAEKFSPLEMEDFISKQLRAHMEEVAREEAAKSGKIVDLQGSRELGEEVGIAADEMGLAEGINAADVGRIIRDAPEMPTAAPSTVPLPDSAGQNILSSKSQQSLAKKLILQDQGNTGGQINYDVLKRMGYDKQVGRQSVEAGRRLYSRTTKALTSAEISPIKPSVQLRTALDKAGISTPQAEQMIVEALASSKDPAIRHQVGAAKAYLLQGTNPMRIAREFGYTDPKKRDYFIRNLESITKTVFNKFGIPR